MEWNVYSQNTPSTPSSTWLCPQNNTPGSEWLHPQNNSTERERNENTAALATPTRYIMEYNDVNQNSSSGAFYNPYAQEMERLFDNNFLKIGNPEDLLNNDIYNNENLSWLNTNENIIPVTTTTSNVITTTTAPSNIPSTTKVTNSPTPSLITDDDQDQLYNNNNLQQEEQRIQNPVTTSASFIQFPIANTITSPTKSSSTSTSPISPHVVKGNHYPITTTAAAFYQPNLQDQFLQSKKHDPKQLLLPLSSVNSNSMDGTMTVSISSPTSSLPTDDDLDQCDQAKTKSRRQNYYQDFPLSISTNDLPMQQPSPASSEFSSEVKTPPPCNETTPKQKKRRVSQRKLNSRRASKVHEGSLISPIDEPYPESNEQVSTSISDDVSDTEESSLINKDTSVSPIDSNMSDSSTKRDVPEDGHDETPEEKRARLLERNRIAAAKCRQKKKQAQESLQQQASDLTQKNTTMHTLVNDLREEALKLKNQLLAHSTCNCNVIQEYVRTSGQFAFARPPYTK
ncbi:hypothetical protein RclHR1_07200009 [Rhizophagus clarus]|uniref:Cyclic AMP-dependent transcription factor ATF-2 n=1 Tax=Rhizophagus clarus TaxID=94130 RepID=A0A2Z6RXR4_9GLOM|nr:hypothetical protein RclHR1_07200009 [Rhizophagus clarus]GES75528.1 cyclic AMP-dependent transcription factor ATF-2 [Rhizophagus clarus]